MSSQIRIEVETIDKPIPYSDAEGTYIFPTERTMHVRQDSCPVNMQQMGSIVFAATTHAVRQLDTTRMSDDPNALEHARNILEIHRVYTPPSAVVTDSILGIPPAILYNDSNPQTYGAGVVFANLLRVYANEPQQPIANTDQRHLPARVASRVAIALADGITTALGKHVVVPVNNTVAQHLPERTFSPGAVISGPYA